MIFIKNMEIARIGNNLVSNDQDIHEILIHDTLNHRLVFLSNYCDDIDIQDIIYYKDKINHFNQIIFSNDNYLNVDGIFINNDIIIRRSPGLIEYFTIFKK
jgi:hypothetical protein